MAEIKSEWRCVTLGDLYDELDRIKTSTAKNDAAHKTLVFDSPDYAPRFNELMERSLTLGEDLRNTAEKLIPVFERLLGFDVFVVEMGSAESVARWVQTAADKIHETHVYPHELRPKITSIGMNEEKGFWIYFNLETKTTGLN